MHDRLTAVLANVLILGTLAYAALLNAFDPDLYYLSAQEDEYVEWATFWAFVLAAVVHCVVALRQRAFRRSWFLYGIGLFCLLVAMEEISWGQRVFGYRPPAYFLANNFQQELNVHNIVRSSYRTLTVSAIILGYGVLLPLAACRVSTCRWLERAGITAPPLGLSPAFLATYLAWIGYAWKFTGEWVELMLALGFLFTGILRARQTASAPRRAAAVAISWLIIAGLGTGTAFAWRHQQWRQPQNVELAQIELDALARDFRSGRLLTECGIHKRLYSYREKYEQSYLHEGEFSRLQAGGLPEARARFLLDPWNSPYWIRDMCDKDGARRRTFVYSLGPNRRRDSTRWQIGGDDIGVLTYAAGDIPTDAAPGREEEP